MSYEKVPKVRVYKHYFLRVIKSRGYSIRRIASELEGASVSPDGTHVTRSDKAIRNALNKGEIRAEVLDAIARLIDVEPKYLAGHFHERIHRLSLEPEFEELVFKDLVPEEFAYGTYGISLVDESLIEQILARNFISRKEFSCLDNLKKLEIALDLQEAIAPVLIKHFPKSARGEGSGVEIHLLTQALREELDYQNKHSES